MSAVITRQAVTTLPVTPQRTIPAQAVAAVSRHDELPHMFGLQMIRAWTSLCHPLVEAGDCIEVDFDRREIRHDGFYMVAIEHEDGTRWLGARRFQFKPAAGRGCDLWGLNVSAQEWAPLSPAMRQRITCFGEILEVFKPVSKMRGGHHGDHH